MKTSGNMTLFRNLRVYFVAEIVYLFWACFVCLFVCLFVSVLLSINFNPAIAKSSR